MRVALGDHEVAAMRRRHPDVFRQPSRHRSSRHGTIAALVAYSAFCFWYFEITPERVFGGLDKMAIVLRSMLIWKDMASWDYGGILQGLAETLGMAFLGTLLASFLAMPLGFLAAKNVVARRILHHLFRRFLDTLRGVDQLIWALVYVRAVGLGPLAGVLAIFTSDTGTLGKLYSEAIENVDRKPLEGVRASGARTMEVLRFGTLPQVLPVFLSQSLYFFESNVRSATVLGVVGAGGIGLQLSERMKVQYWDQAAFIILLILIMVAIIDHLSKTIRLRLIGGSGL